MSQLNELLLLVHKDRVELPFFNYFFGSACTVETIPAGVRRFQQTAMLRYGNFVFAYRKLSRIKTHEALLVELDEAARDPEVELNRLLSRKPKLLETDKTDRGSTPFVGYLSAGQIRAELPRCELLLKAAELTGPPLDWEAYNIQVRTLASDLEWPVLQEIIHNFQLRTASALASDFVRFLRDSHTTLSSLRSDVDQCAGQAGITNLGATRPSPHLRPPVPRFRRRTGTDSVSAWPRFCPNN